MTPPTVYDATGQRLVLGRELGRGGEGAVFEVPGAPGGGAGHPLVAKLYQSPPTADKARKLATMSRGATPALLSIAAWPVGTLHTARGAVIGLTMQRITHAHEVHFLYGPSHRRSAFPAADWKFLVRAARNLAAAVATVHHAGAVIGDINQGNALVDAAARIKLIDCDSFQVRGDHGAWHLCEVGIGHFTPPELQGVPLDRVTRTPQHDAFGLAVLVFHLLFMGRHPFVGQFHGAGDMPIERAITEHRFAFGAAARTRLMSRPPHSLALGDTSGALAALFERAFAPDAAAGRVARPSAGEWVVALEAFERTLAPCAASVVHQVPAGAPQCPWCAIEAHGGPDFFLSVRYARAGTTGPSVQLPAGFDYARLVQQVQRTAWPPSSLAPIAPSPAAPPLEEAMVRRARQARGAWLTGLGALAGGAVGIAPVPAAVLGGGLVALAAGLERRSGVQRLRRDRRAALGAAGAHAALTKQEHDAFERDVATKVGQLQQAFRQAVAKYDHAGADEQRELARLASTQQADQLRDFLDRFYIDQADIPGFGQGLKTTLASYGIETAADVATLGRRKVPGIGIARAQELRAWRDRVQRGFRFNGAVGANPAATAAIRDKAARVRAAAAREMIVTAEELTRRVHAGLARRHDLVAAQQAAAAHFGTLRAEVAALDTELRVTDVVTGRRGVGARIALAVGALLLVGQLAGTTGVSDGAGGSARDRAGTPSPPQAATGATRASGAPWAPGYGPSSVPGAPPAAAPTTSSNGKRPPTNAAAVAPTPTSPRVTLAARCGQADSVCVFPAARLRDPVLYETGRALATAPLAVRTGWFHVELRDGGRGFVRSVDMPRFLLPDPPAEPVYVP